MLLFQRRDARPLLVNFKYVRELFVFACVCCAAVGGKGPSSLIFSCGSRHYPEKRLYQVLNWSSKKEGRRGVRNRQVFCVKQLNWSEPKKITCL